MLRVTASIPLPPPTTTYSDSKRRVSRKAVDWAKRGPLWLCKGAERTALLVAVAAMAWGGWMAGQHPNKLGWGVLMAVTGEQISARDSPVLCVLEGGFVPSAAFISSM